MKSILDRLFEYDNYRTFLEDYYAFMKKKKAAFTLKYFAKKAGLNSASFCMYIMDGRRNLSYRTIPRFVQALELKGKKAEYFEALVLMNQSVTLEEKERYANAITKLRKTTKYYSLEKWQHAYFEEWYYPVLRELAAFADWEGDYSRLGRMVRPAITADKAKKAVELLVDIGLLVKKEDGRYAQAEVAIDAEGLPQFLIRKVRRDFLMKGIEASETIPPQECHVSCSTVALSRENFQRASMLLTEFHKELAEMAETDQGHAANTVFQVNLEAFPLSNQAGEKR
ncbi:MAG TPA: TIGR02147 family protein [Fibrobacteria bacterium]|nr:TIGR02147 family protein [Fibrobacteria bacterium]